MILQPEIERVQQRLTTEFTGDEVAAMISQAIQDLRSRNIAGAIIVPLAYLVGGLATDYAAQHRFLFASLGIFLALAICLRLASIIAFTKTDLARTRVWLPLFFIANLGCGLSWGLFPATAIVFYHDSVSITLIIILLAGIGAGAMSSYCIWRPLAYSYQLTVLGLPMLAEFFIGNELTIPIGVAIALFLTFNLIQIKRWNEEYWVSLMNTFLFKRNSRELSRVNEKLAEEIEDHKRTTEQIDISRKKLRDIYHAVHDAIFIVSLDGRTIDVNETMLAMYETDRPTALQFDITKSFSTSSNPDINMAHVWQRALKGEDQEFEWIAHKQRSATPFTVQVNLRKTLWGDEPVIIATVRDISVQIKALNAAQAANLAKSEFLANISHELRTPMHGILGYARLGIKRADTLPREKLTEYYSLIQESGSRLMGLLNNLLDFSRLEVGKMQYSMVENDLLPRIYQVTTELAPIAEEKKVAFIVECDQGEVPAYCDQEKICQILRNLLYNGIKFCKDSSTITIHCEQMGDDPVQRISVANFGATIPESEIRSIFKKFIQSSVTYTGAGGTGLGLAISRQIIEDHGGIIWAENRDDGAVVFSFLLSINKEHFTRTRELP
ncbi:MAG: PAS domain-containing sensor histidine kinase [Thermodesulfobacteriota bacterium]